MSKHKTITSGRTGLMEGEPLPFLTEEQTCCGREPEISNN